MSQNNVIRDGVALWLSCPRPIGVLVVFLFRWLKKTIITEDEKLEAFSLIGNIPAGRCDGLPDKCASCSFFEMPDPPMK